MDCEYCLIPATTLQQYRRLVGFVDVGSYLAHDSVRLIAWVFVSALAFRDGAESMARVYALGLGVSVVYVLRVDENTGDWVIVSKVEV